MPAYTHFSGTKAAVQIAKEAAKGTLIGVALGFGYKVAILDSSNNATNNFYKRQQAAEENK